MATTTVKKSKKTKRIVQSGNAYIRAGYNNTIVTITDEKGDVLTWSSGGNAGFKGAREATPYAAQVASQKAAEEARTLHGLESVAVYVKGIGIGREQAIRGLIAAGLDLSAIFDITGIPHGGCRPKKIRHL